MSMQVYMMFYRFITFIIKKMFTISKPLVLKSLGHLVPKNLLLN